MIYIDQRKKLSVPGIPNWAQCFYCSVVMWLTFYVRTLSAELLYFQYFDEVETSWGEKGTGELTVAREHLAGRSGQYWDVHRDGANKYLAPFEKKAVWAEIDWSEVDEKLKTGPVVCGTIIPSSDGHIIVIKERRGDFYIVLDPYGDGRSRYSDPKASGENLEYRVAWLRACASYGGKARVMWAEQIK